MIGMWHWIRMTMWIVLGLLGMWYGLYVRNAGAGNKFYRIWFVIGIALFGLAAMAHWQVWGKLPKGVRITAIVVIAIGFAVYMTILVRILAQFHEDGGEAEYLIVLGAQVREDGPSVVLTYRLEKAAEYLAKHPKTKCIVSGGQGPNEPTSEAEGMRDYLTAHGVDASRIILEDKSTDTSENLKYCLELLPSADTRVAVITNNFHMYRALGIAQKCGYGDVVGVGADSKLSYLPHNLTREVVGVLKDILMGNMKIH